MDKRFSEIERKTKETNISAAINLDGDGTYSIMTPVGFLNHMLELFSKHGNFDLKIDATGDIEVDFHHIIEDIGIVLGECIRKALGSFSGIKRYGNKTIPMDESLSMVTIDISNRAFLVYNVKFEKDKVGNVDIELFEEFFQAFANNLKCNIHINNFYGKNSHHILESIFKAFAYSLKEAVTITDKGFLSTKGIL
jgi:imidazoleglycerol-phosphate dehydratase